MRRMTAKEFANAYADSMYGLWESFEVDKIAEAAELVEKTINNSGTIYSCGNGGSAAVANHLVCDFQKGRRDGSGGLKVKAVSLSNNIELIGAISNDIVYHEIFSFQLANMARSGDLLIAFSTSGTSQNIIYAIAVAKSLHMPVIAVTGVMEDSIDADIHIQFSPDNAGMNEDLFQSVMHIIAQYLWQEDK